LHLKPGVSRHPTSHSRAQKMSMAAIPYATCGL
jgi:hypothetical protein